MMGDRRPQLVVIGGPNGAGKSTVAPSLLRDRFGLTDFLNSDDIARGLSLNPESAAFEAGRIFLRRFDELASRRASFGFESTLAGRHRHRRVEQLKGAEYNYEFHLVFLWLRSPELAVERVRQRVRAGGHHVPEADVRRRYRGGLNNFFRHYRALADSWLVYDTSVHNSPATLAVGEGVHSTQVLDEEGWRLFCESTE
jgi:predicted ABC-type ATPase